MLQPAAQDPNLWAPLTFSHFLLPVAMFREPLNCPGSLGLFEHTASLSEPSPQPQHHPAQMPFSLLSQKVTWMTWARACLSLTVVCLSLTIVCLSLALVWEPVLNLLQTEFHEEQCPQLP